MIRDEVDPDWTLAVAAYDAIAPIYDGIPRENRINAYMRSVSQRVLQTTLGNSEKVLELGCGTGDEAATLASRGVRIVGLDPSAEMIDIARKKARLMGLEDRMQFHVAASKSLLIEKIRDEAPFDGAYASFSLGYEPDLAPVAGALHKILVPGAPLVASLPSRHCAMEIVLALAIGRPSLGWRRFQDWQWHKVGAFRVPVRSFTPRTLIKEVAPAFALERVEAIAFLVPPPYVNRWYSRFPPVCDALESMDRFFRSRFPFTVLGDHFIAIMRHRSGLPGSVYDAAAM